MPKSSSIQSKWLCHIEVTAKIRCETEILITTLRSCQTNSTVMDEDYKCILLKAMRGLWHFRFQYRDFQYQILRLWEEVLMDSGCCRLL